MRGNSKTQMSTILEMVKILRRSPVVVGLAEYGSASYLDERIDGDYDLIVITNTPVSDVESLHFYVKDTPVDLNVRSLERIGAMSRADGFDSTLLDARIIHDPSGEVGQALEGLRDRHVTTPGPVIEQDRIAAMRHGAKHTFDKLREGRDLPLVLKRYMLHQCVYWALPQYFEIRGLQYRGEKQGLAYLRENEPELYQSVEEFYATTDPCEQARLARSIEEAVLAPVGGLWEDRELLAFGDQSKGDDLFRLLFGRPVPSEDRTAQPRDATDGSPRRR